MRNLRSGAEAPRTSKLARRATAVALAGGMGLGLAGCGLDGTSNSSLTNGSNVENCGDLSWETSSSLTLDPATASSSMQQAITELIDKVSKSGAKEDADGVGYEISSIPEDLVGTATAVLNHSIQNRYVLRSSILQNYGNEVCTDDITYETYLTPAYMSAVGALAANGIEVNTGVTPASAD